MWIVVHIAPIVFLILALYQLKPEDPTIGINFFDVGYFVSVNISYENITKTRDTAIFISNRQTTVSLIK